MNNLFLTFLEISGGTAVIILVVWLLSALINRSFTAKWKYWLWLLLAVRLLIPFNPSFDAAPPVEVSIPNAAISLPVAAPMQTEPVQLPQDQVRVELQAAEPTLTTMDILLLVWAVGAAAFIIWQLAAYHLFRRRIYRWSCPAQKDGLAARTKQQIQDALGIKAKISLLICREVTSPMMLGFFRPLLILPREDYTEQEMAFILRHELTHFQRRDIWYKALMLLANAVHWFNPAVWLMVRCASRDLEISCDAAVVAGCDMDTRRRYSETILATVHREAKTATALSTHFYGGKKMLKERFANILSTKKRRKGIFAFAAVVLCAALACGLVACSMQEADSTDVSSEMLTDFSAHGHATSFHTITGPDIPTHTRLATEADVEQYQQLLAGLDADDAVCFEANLAPYDRDISVELTREQVAAVMDILRTVAPTVSEPTNPATGSAFTLYIETPEVKVGIQYNESWLVIGRAGEETALIFDGAACTGQFSAIHDLIAEFLGETAQITVTEQMVDDDGVTAVSIVVQDAGQMDTIRTYIDRLANEPIAVVRDPGESMLEGTTYTVTVQSSSRSDEYLFIQYRDGYMVRANKIWHNADPAFYALLVSLFQEAGAVSSDSISGATLETIFPNLPENMTIQGNALYATEDSRILAELTAVESLANPDDPFSHYDQLYAEAVRSENGSWGGYSGKWYWLQEEITGEAVSGFNNYIVYCIQAENVMVVITFYPAQGLGGVGAQREAFEEILDTIHVVSNVGDADVTDSDQIQSDALPDDAAVDSTPADSAYIKQENPGQVNPNPGQNDSALNTDEAVYFWGTVVEYNDSTVIIEPIQGTDERRSTDRIAVSADWLEEGQKVHLKKGAEVVIGYDGNIIETYPAQIDNIIEFSIG